MERLIFRALLTYALGKGTWKGITRPYPKRHTTTAAFNLVLKDMYLKGLKEALNARPVLFDIIGVDNDRNKTQPSEA